MGNGICRAKLKNIIDVIWYEFYTKKMRINCKMWLVSIYINKCMFDRWMIHFVKRSWFIKFTPYRIAEYSLVNQWGTDYLQTPVNWVLQPASIYTIPPNAAELNGQYIKTRSHGTTPDCQMASCDWRRIKRTHWQPITAEVSFTAEFHSLLYGLYSLRRRASCRKISGSVEATIFGAIRYL